MAETFRTSEIAALIGVHPNTVRSTAKRPENENAPDGQDCGGT